MTQIYRWDIREWKVVTEYAGRQCTSVHPLFHMDDSNTLITAGKNLLKTGHCVQLTGTDKLQLSECYKTKKYYLDYQLHLIAIVLFNMTALFIFSG